MNRRDFSAAWPWVACLGLTLGELWLTSSQTLTAIGASRHDDLHFLTQAHYLLQGAWLGPYDQLTLIKGPFFPAFIAFGSAVGIPLLTLIQLLYVLACVVFVQAVKPVLRNGGQLVVLFGVLLFNPASDTARLARVMRETITPALMLMTVACSVALAVRSGQSGRRPWVWAAGLGLSFGALWLTREEGLVTVPVVVFSAAMALILAWRQRGPRALPAEVGRWLLAAGLWGIALLVVAALNYTHYGLFAKTEFDAVSYQASYGALSRVKPEEFKPLVPVSRETRRRIYQVSPAFAELRPYIEGVPGSHWESYSEEQQEDANRHEILAGWFSWAYRDAVAEAGYYDAGRYPEAFYQRVADEVNSACEEELLDCYGPRATVLPVWHNAYLRQLVPALMDRLAELATFGGMTVDLVPSRGSEELLTFFATMTGNRISAPESDAGRRLLATHRQILEYLLLTYRAVTPLLALLALGTYLFLTRAILRGSRPIETWAVMTAALLLSLSRAVLVAYLHVTSLRILPGAYLYEAYPALLAFLILGCFYLVDLLAGRRRGASTPAAAAAEKGNER